MDYMWAWLAIWVGIIVLMFIFEGLKHGFARTIAAIVAAAIVFFIRILIAVTALKPIHDAAWSISPNLGVVFNLLIGILITVAGSYPGR